MIFIDTDVFAIDLLFKWDKRFEANKEFLDGVGDKATSIFNLLELCGIASFSKLSEDVEQMFIDFHKDRAIEIIYPGLELEDATDFFEKMVDQSLERIKRKMGFGDSLILWMCEEKDCTIFVTWNPRHFVGRTRMEVVTPKEFIREY